MIALAVALMVSIAAQTARASAGDDDGSIPPDHSRVPMKEVPGLAKRATAIGDRGVLGDHLDQARINSGEAKFDEVFKHGAHLFKASFNEFDGQGRPNFTSGAPRPTFNEKFFRTGGPDSTNCWSCHNLPRSGGGGDFNSLMFSGLHARNPPEFNTVTALTNHRAGPSVFGDGPLELAAREMSFELAAIRSAARAEAAASGQSVTKDLVTKGVSFGKLTALPTGKLDPSQIQGVDWDLIVKPHTHKGTSVTLRGFPTGGGNLHMGMQGVERFGVGTDPDGDGVTDEFSIGDVTAMTVWMASLPVPGRVLPKDPGRRQAMVRGEELFAQIQCASCHMPAMLVDNPMYSEPGPFNGAGSLTVAQLAAVGAKPFTFDITRDGPGPRPERTSDGSAVIRAFTDLKRHNITDPSGRLSDEQIPGGSLRGTAPASDFTIAAPSLAVNVFMTEKLWDAGNTAPYGHRGDLSTFTLVIGAHGGEASASRGAFQALSSGDQACVIEFLRSLQIVPPDAPRVTFEGDDTR
jgi:mono/diheme cytochrome c family protein